jgi:hypothetical protein
LTTLPMVAGLMPGQLPLAVSVNEVLPDQAMV